MCYTEPNFLFLGSCVTSAKMPNHIDVGRAGAMCRKDYTVGNTSRSFTLPYIARNSLRHMDLRLKLRWCHFYTFFVFYITVPLQCRITNNHTEAWRTLYATAEFFVNYSKPGMYGDAGVG